MSFETRPGPGQNPPSRPAFNPMRILILIALAFLGMKMMGGMQQGQQSPQGQQGQADPARQLPPLPEKSANTPLPSARPSAPPKPHPTSTPPKSDWKMEDVSPSKTGGNL